MKFPSDHSVTGRARQRGRQPSALGHQEGLQDSQNDLRELETQTCQETFQEMLVIL